jgi:hypothetical protein
VIAINWFALSFNSKECVLRVDDCFPPNDVPRAIRTHDHRTVLVRADTSQKIYHIGLGAPASLPTERLLITARDSRVASTLIEMSFAAAATKAGFEVTFRRLGAAASREQVSSSRPSVFLTREGFTYRAFSFLEPERDELRWGLILNYQAGQRFVVTLADPRLRSLALNKRVLRINENHDVEDTGLLVAIGDDHVVVAHKDGTTTREHSSEWVAQCRKDLLFEYIAATEGRAAASEVSLELQRASMALTEKGRINVNLAKDQILRVQKLIRDCDLASFRLFSVDNGPLARMTLDPLGVEA